MNSNNHFLTTAVEIISGGIESLDTRMKRSIIPLLWWATRLPLERANLVLEVDVWIVCRADGIVD